MKNSLLWFTRFNFRFSKALCNFASRAGASSEKIIACTSNLKGTEASPSSSTRSWGFNLRVIPILYIPSPNDPMLEITYTYPAFWLASL